MACKAGTKKEEGISYKAAALCGFNIVPDHYKGGRASSARRRPRPRARAPARAAAPRRHTPSTPTTPSSD